MSREFTEYMERDAFNRGVNVGAGAVTIVIGIIFGLIIWFAHSCAKDEVRQIVNEKYATPATYITLEANYTNIADKVATINRLTDEAKANGFTVTKVDSELSFSTVNCIRVQGKK